MSIPEDARTEMLRRFSLVTREAPADLVRHVSYEWHVFKNRINEEWASTPEEIKVLLLSVWRTAEFKAYRSERWRRTTLTPTYRAKRNRKAKAKYRESPETKREKVRLAYWRAKGLDAPPPKRKYERSQPVPREPLIGTPFQTHKPGEPDARPRG
jgi:hypothetical protein